MPDLRSALFEKLKPRLRDIMGTAGEIAVDRLRAKVSVPALILSNGAVIGSYPGQYPRKRTGSLEESLDHQVYVRSNNVYLKFGAMHDTRLNGQKRSPTIYARILEHFRNRKLTQAIWNDPGTKRAITSAIKGDGVKASDLSKYVRIPAPGKLVRNPVDNDWQLAARKYQPVE